MRFFWLLLLLAGSLLPARAQAPLEVGVDHATFAFSETHALLEVYLGVGVRSLIFHADSTGYGAALPVRLRLYPAVTTTLLEQPVSPVWSDSLTLRFRLPDTTGLRGNQYFVHALRLTVPPGEYDLRLHFAREDGRTLEVQREVRVPDYTDRQVRFADIELASSIASGGHREHPFYKNGLLIHPNPNTLYGGHMARLYYYTELYHLDEALQGEYTLLAYLASTQAPQPLEGYSKRVTRPVRSPDVVVGMFDLKALPTGAYYLRLAVLNRENEALAEQTRKFFVYNPDVPTQPTASLSDVDVESSLFLTMTEEELQEALEHARIIATGRELKQMKRLKDVEAMREFLIQFWRRRDPDPSTPLNEYRQEFYSRLQYANERYSTRFQPGWKTDRGRVIVKYGPPSEVEPHLYDRDAVPYEIWRYNNIPGEGQAVFIFADRNGFGEFELIHSTVTGERKSPNWEGEVRRIR